MENHEKEKRDFEIKIEGYEKEDIRLKKKIEDQKIKVVVAEKKHTDAEKSRIAWEKKYEEEKEKRLKGAGKLTDLKGCKLEYGKLELRLEDCETGVKKTKKSLIACQILTLEIEAQKKNWIENYELLEKKSFDLINELGRRQIVIKKLEKAKGFPWWKKGIIVVAGFIIGKVL